MKHLNCIMMAFCLTAVLSGRIPAFAFPVSETDTIVVLDSELHQQVDIYLKGLNNFARHDFQYDSAGNILQDTEYLWEEDLEFWANWRKISYSCDSAGNRLQEISHKWGEDQGDWIPEDRNDYGYDAQANRIWEEKLEWDAESGQWKYQGVKCWGPRCSKTWVRKEWQYDDKGRQTMLATYTWEDAMEIQVPLYREVNGYNSMGLQNFTEQSYWDSSRNDLHLQYRRIREFFPDSSEAKREEYRWLEEEQALVLIQRMEATMDSSARIKTRIEHIWDTDSAAWVKNWMKEDRFDAGWRRMDYTQYYWHVERESWIPESRVRNSYDDRGRLLETIEYRDSDGMYLLPYDRVVFLYDSLSRLAGRFYSEWDPATWEWMNNYKEQYLFDSKGKDAGRIEFTWDAQAKDWELEFGYRSERTFDPAGRLLVSDGYQKGMQFVQWTLVGRTTNIWSYDLVTDGDYTADENTPHFTHLGALRTGSMYEPGEIGVEILQAEPDTGIVFQAGEEAIMLLVSDTLDYESSETYTLTIRATCERGGRLIADTARLLIRLKNLNDNPPVVEDVTYTIREDINRRQYLGRVQFTDADDGIDTMAFRIIAGNDHGVFSIHKNASIYLEDHGAIDYEAQHLYELIVEVHDGIHRGEGRVSIEVTEVSEPTSVRDPIDAEGHSPDRLKLYPNPVHDILHLEYAGGPCTLRIITAEGTCVHAQNLASGTLETSHGTLETDLSHLAPGVYILSLRTREGVITRKLLKN